MLVQSCHILLLSPINIIIIMVHYIIYNIMVHLSKLQNYKTNNDILLLNWVSLYIISFSVISSLCSMIQSMLPHCIYLSWLLSCLWPMMESQFFLVFHNLDTWGVLFRFFVACPSISLCLMVFVLIRWGSCVFIKKSMEETSASPYIISRVTQHNPWY